MVRFLKNKPVLIFPKNVLNFRYNLELEPLNFSIYNNKRDASGVLSESGIAFCVKEDAAFRPVL